MSDDFRQRLGEIVDDGTERLDADDVVDALEEQGELYGDMEARGNRLVTLYDAEFDSLGAREISQFIYPGETNALKEIEQRRE